VLIKILLVLVAIVAVFAGVVAMQPADFRIERSATIAAPRTQSLARSTTSRLASLVPWAKLDPNAKNTFEGPESGSGAIFKWSGNNDVGEGMMTLTDSQPNERIKIKLESSNPSKTPATPSSPSSPRGMDPRHVEHGGPQELHQQGVLHVHRHGQDGRRPVRQGPEPDSCGGRAGERGAGNNGIARRCREMS